MIKKNVTRRTFKSKKNPAAALRQKAPKIQRLITDVRLRRKRINKEDKVRRWKKTIEARAAYSKLIDEHVAKRKAAAKTERKDSVKPAETKPVVVEAKKDTKKVAPAPVVAAGKNKK